MCPVAQAEATQFGGKTEIENISSLALKRGVGWNVCFLCFSGLHIGSLWVHLGYLFGSGLVPV